MAICKESAQRERLCGRAKWFGRGEAALRASASKGHTWIDLVWQVHRAAEKALAEIEISDDDDMMHEDEEPEII